MESNGLNIPCHWDCKSLVDCTSNKNISYGIVQPGQHDETGIGLIRVNNFENGELNTSDVLKVTPSLEKKFAKTRLSGGEVLLTLVGSTGQSSVVPNELKGWNVARAVAVIKPSDEVTAEWLNICLQSSHTRNFLDARANTTVQKTLNLKDVKQIPIPLPPKEERDELESIAVNLNKKITLNRKINQTLEQMAQTLFKSWFVDFDPVVDNALDAGFFDQDLAFPDELLRRAEAREMVRKSSDFKPFPDDVRQLFPDSFKECSEPSLGLGGWVPEGWSQGCISDIAHYRAERVNTAELTLDNYISTENMLVERKGVQPATSLPTANSVPAYTSGTVLVSNIRPYFKKIWLAQGDGGYSNDVLGFEANVSGTECYLFNLMYQDTFFDFMMATSKGSKMPRGDKKAILGWGLVVPPLSLRLFFSEKLNDFYTSANSRHHENITLSHLRDTLLPKLISGEIRLSDIKTESTDEVLA